MIVQFQAGRDGNPMCTIDGKVSFPPRGSEAKVGESWEVEIAGSNPKNTVNFLKLVRKATPKTYQVIFNEGYGRLGLSRACRIDGIISIPPRGDNQVFWGDTWEVSVAYHDGKANVLNLIRRVSTKEERDEQELAERVKEDELDKARILGRLMAELENEQIAAPVQKEWFVQNFPDAMFYFDAFNRMLPNEVEHVYPSPKILSGWSYRLGDKSFSPEAVMRHQATRIWENNNLIASQRLQDRVNLAKEFLMAHLDLFPVEEMSVSVVTERSNAGGYYKDDEWHSYAGSPKKWEVVKVPARFGIAMSKWAHPWDFKKGEMPKEVLEAIELKMANAPEWSKCSRCEVCGIIVGKPNDYANESRCAECQSVSVSDGIVSIPCECVQCHAPVERCISLWDYKGGERPHWYILCGTCA